MKDPNIPTRYTDPQTQRPIVKILPCQLYVTEQMDEVLATVLGSCVSLCIRDPVAEVAGMNHYMLPCTEAPRSNDRQVTLRYGNHSMDILLEEMFRRGARLNRLEVKLFGGARVTAGQPVGEENARFALEYLKRHHLPIAAQHLGGIAPRSLQYYPGTGVVLMKRLRPNPALLAEIDSVGGGEV